MKVLKKHRKVLLYIFGLFVITRLILTVIGFTGFELLDPYKNTAIHSEMKTSMYANGAVNIWLNWDSGHYYNIATHGYWVDKPNYGFFPLYPILIRIISFVTSLGASLSGLIVANIAFIVACWYLYKLVLLDESKETSLRSIKYLFLFPLAFVYSGMLTESLFIMLAIMAMYFARTNRWWVAGVAVGLLSATRSLGVFMAIPLAYEYMYQRSFDFKKLKLDVLSFLIMPLGLMFFMYYNFRITGDWLAFKTIQTLNMHNPLDVLGRGIQSRYSLQIIIVAGFLVLMAVSVKKIRFSYWLFAMFYIMFPILTGDKYFPSLLRYISIAFPLFITLAVYTKNKRIDTGLTIALALLQGFLMVIWVNSWLVYIV